MVMHLGSKGREDGPHGTLRFFELRNDAAFEAEVCEGPTTQSQVVRMPHRAGL
jgi:hypothetical protein